MASAFARFVRDERGVDLLEYSLLMVLLVLALWTSLEGLTVSIGGLFDSLLESW